MLTLAVCTLILGDQWIPLHDTGSPSGKYQICWQMPGAGITLDGSGNTNFPDNFDPDKVINGITNTRTGEMVCFLKNLNGFTNENHGGTMTTWKRDETLVLVDHEGRWEPAQMMVASPSGATREIWPTLHSALAKYAKAHRGRFTRSDTESFVFSIGKTRWSGSSLVIGFHANIPKDERDWEVPMLATVSVRVRDGAIVAPSIFVQEGKKSD